MKVELVTSTKGEGKYSKLNYEEIVAAIARHGIIKEDNGKLVKYLMDKKHWSPLDMVNFGFEIETSRSIGRQLLRHSSIKPQEHSQRYSSEVSFQNIELRMEHPINRQSSTDVINPKVNISWTVDDTHTMQASEAIDDILDKIQGLYFALLESGIAKECARDILPGCTTTIITMNGSLRSWLAFLNVRMDLHSQKEIVLIAEIIGQELENKLPNVFSIIEWRNGMFM